MRQKRSPAMERSVWIKALPPVFMMWRWNKGTSFDRRLFQTLAASAGRSSLLNTISYRSSEEAIPFTRSASPFVASSNLQRPALPVGSGSRNSKPW